MAMLLDIKGIGPEFAAVLWMEAFFCSFNNRKQVAGLRGVGADALAKRIGRSRTGRFESRQSVIADNAHPARLDKATPSAVIGVGSLWFKERVTRSGGRFKKTAIVALARKLLVAL
jgi:transposase